MADDNIFEEANDWWKDFIKTREQKKELEIQIKKDLESQMAYYKTYLEHSYAIHSLAEKHDDILNKVKNNFDGAAQNALVERFFKNSYDIKQINRSYNDLIMELKIQSWFL